MDSSCKKIYGVDEEEFLSQHYPHLPVVESIMHRIQSVCKAFLRGLVTGKTLIDFCPAPIFLHLFPLKVFVEDITLVQINDEGVQEIEKWLTKHPEACDWSHTAGIVKKFKGISDESEDEEENIRGKIKVLKWDLSDDNPAEALSLKEADIASSTWFLETISKDHDEYRRNLRKISNVIKPEGFLLIQTNVNSSYVKVGEETFHFLPCDESFYRKVLREEGFDIKHHEIFDRAMVTDTTDHDAGMFIIAHKVREPPGRGTS